MKFPVLLTVLVLVATGAAADTVKLPKEVTPALRSACEQDVRRLCIRKKSTIASVRSCVVKNFGKLNMRRQIRLVQAGM
jgi:hypothetical protein